MHATAALPGTLVARPNARPTRIVVRTFGSEAYEEHEASNAAELDALRDPSRCTWIEVTGLADTKALAAIGRTFGLHMLSLEDVLDPTQRAKVEHYDGYTFVVLRTLAKTDCVEALQLSLFLGEGFVLSVQDVDHPSVELVRERLRNGRGKIRSRGADYLAYSLIDGVIDTYFPALEDFDDHLEHVEDAMLDARITDPVDLVRGVRRDLQVIRHAIWPARDAIAALLREDVPRISDDTRVHLRDCYDHVMQLQEMVESSREIVASLLEAHLSRVSLRTNEVMKVLTVIATIFIPLTFITGVYGMNFDPKSSPLNMPELAWYWGYPFALFLMIGAAVASLSYFRKKGWFGDDTRT